MNEKEIRRLLNAAVTVRTEFGRLRLGPIDSLGMQILMLLAVKPHLSLKSCAKELAATQPNVSTSVKGLVDVKLVLREPLERDPRTHSLSITAKGEAAVAEFIGET